MTVKTFNWHEDEKHFIAQVKEVSTINGLKYNALKV